jgi:hypothetical protein
MRGLRRDAGGLWLEITLKWGDSYEILYTYFAEFPFHDVREYGLEEGPEPVL